MTIALRAAGAWAAGTTSVTPALPTGVAAGDMMVLFVGCKGPTTTIVIPTGWTLMASDTNGGTAPTVDLGSVKFASMYRRWLSGDTAPAVTLTGGDVGLAVIHAFSKTAPNWLDPVAGTGGDTASNLTLSIQNANSEFDWQAGDMVLHGAVIAGNNATFGTPTITIAGQTIGTVTESPTAEGSTNSGTDLEASASYAAITAGDSNFSGAQCQWILSAAQTGGGVNTRLRESFPTPRPIPLVPGQAVHASAW